MKSTYTRYICRSSEAENGLLRRKQNPFKKIGED